ncbi:unnamed protein product [Cylicocyclus nassatus]|uniref:Uncharacterized protein n=1 Tax=Cylicocyclus nassatus TaxID=53992 RepID=A0AA36H2B0_CYLNA|nr:unnamed protein product [Cylicocyclus nassatus]
MLGCFYINTSKPHFKSRVHLKLIKTSGDIRKKVHATKGLTTLIQLLAAASNSATPWILSGISGYSFCSRL